MESIKTIYNFQKWIEKQNKQLKKLNEQFPLDNQLKLFFRGVSNAKYENTPSIYRNHKLIRQEDFIYKECLRYSPHEFAGEKTCFDALVKLQHYGLPTRLLDLTTNPYVALFFAVHPYRIKLPPMAEIENKISSLTHDELKNYLTVNFAKYGVRTGKVYAVYVSEKSQKFTDSDTISIIANIAKRPLKHLSGYLDIYKNYLEKIMDKNVEDIGPDFWESVNKLTQKFVAEFNESEPISYLLHEIKNEKPYFGNLINVEDMQSVWYVAPNMNNNRIIRQDGSFLIYGLSGNKKASLSLPSIEFANQCLKLAKIKEAFGFASSRREYIAYFNKLKNVLVSINFPARLLNTIDNAFLQHPGAFDPSGDDPCYRKFLYKADKVILLQRLRLMVDSAKFADLIKAIEPSHASYSGYHNQLKKSQEAIAKLGLLHGMLTNSNIIFTDDIEIEEKEILEKDLNHMDINYGKLFPELDSLSEYLTDRVLI